MSARTKTEPVERVSPEELDAILEQTRTSALNEEQHRKLKVALKMLAFLSAAIAAKNASIRRLRKLLFGPKSEEKRKILGGSDDSKDENREDLESQDGLDRSNESGEEAAKEKKKRKGHGRKAADDYSSAERIYISHESLHHGDSCPDPLCEAQGGKVYRLKDPKQRVRVLGQAALFAVIYLLERLRCNLCGTIYTAEPPEGVGSEKYDITAVSMMAILRYGAGLPLHRLAQLQSDLGVPLAAATQWDTVSQAEPLLRPVYEELVREAAQGTVLHNDDTGMAVLELMKEDRERRDRGEAPDRTGIFTTGIVSVREKVRIALYFTGRNHAGENLNSILGKRSEELGPAIQMCDALSRNVPEDFKTILCNCTVHARRQYVDVVEDFPEESKFVVETLAQVFKNDRTARKREMTDGERLDFHRRESMRPMAALRLWMWRQFRERRVEPNSGLGQAIKYMRKHWRKLTRFLFVAGAPLENNIVERTLKRAICHRKNSLFYKTRKGARVGDLYMSLITTCQLAGENPFDYLTEIQRHSAEVAKEPGKWLPWNYRDALDAAPG